MQSFYNCMTMFRCIFRQYILGIHWDIQLQTRGISHWNFGSSPKCPYINYFLNYRYYSMCFVLIRSQCRFGNMFSVPRTNDWIKFFLFSIQFHLILTLSTNSSHPFLWLQTFPLAQITLSNIGLLSYFSNRRFDLFFTGWMNLNLFCKMILYRQKQNFFKKN